MQNRFRSWQGAGAFLLFAVCSALLRLPHFGNPAPDFDEQLYHLIGSRMLDGYVPYVDLWDRKPIGLFLIYAFGALISGGSVYGYQVLAALSAAWTAWLAWTISRRFAGQFACVVGGLMCLLAFPMYYGPVGQSEVFYIPITLLMLLFTLRASEADDREFVKFAMIAMALGGLSLQVKYTAVFVCIACGISLLVIAWQRFRDVKRVFGLAALFGILGVLPTLIAALVYAAMGQLDAFLFANFFSILERGRPSGAATVMWGKVILVKALLPACAAVAGVLLVLMRRQLTGGRVIVLAYAAGALISYFALGSAYPYYFIAAAIGCNLLAVWLIDEPIIGKLVAVILIAVSFWAGRVVLQWSDASEQKAAIEKLADAVRPYVSAKRCLFVFDGPTALYSLSDTCFPTRYIYPDHLNNALERNSLGIDQAKEIERVLSSRPGAVVIAPQIAGSAEHRANRKSVNDFLTRNCQLVEKAALSSRYVSVFRCAQP
ncbi:ArnT family glycosyltransferase [Croceicoccus sediminis]|uniref:ArnT family glycosyltransferase n=1 Tax=Croceicoccus sediminis TaxID=2571150 RepID=UPI001183075C|nr:glycosyltransferase family 39 protein [Croceicoccus sediminis]